MSNKIIRFNESFFSEIPMNFPKKISLFTTNGNFVYFYRGIYNDGLYVKVSYSDKNDYVNEELSIAEPDSLIIELRLHKNEHGDQKFIVDIIYGRATKFQFTMEKPNILDVTHYNGFGSKFDPESKFSFSDESVKDLVNCFNSIGFKYTEKHFEFLDKNPYNYQYHESLNITPLFGGIILVLNNAQPNRRSYIPNLSNYLKTRGIEHIVTTSVTEVDSILKKHNVIGVISAGSDYRISSSKNNQSEQELSHKALTYIKKPFIGMCYGFQSLANFYGSKIKDSERFFNDNIKLSNWSKDSSLFRNVNLDDFQLSVSFYDMVSECPNDFEVIAEYDGYIFGIGSEELMRWGLAFHPEDIEKTYPILDNFIEICRKHQNPNTEVLNFAQFERYLVR